MSLPDLSRLKAALAAIEPRGRRRKAEAKRMPEASEPHQPQQADMFPLDYRGHPFRVVTSIGEHLNRKRFNDAVQLLITTRAKDHQCYLEVRGFDGTYRRTCDEQLRSMSWNIP